VAGNKLNASKEVKFTTVPTHGRLTGTVKESGGAVVKGAVLRLTQGNETVVVNLSKDGSFVVESLRAGTWTVRGEARGYISLDTTVTVEAGRSVNQDFLMEKDLLPTLIGTAVGAVVLLVVLFLLVRMFAKKCHVCKNRLPRGANACPVCGNVAKHKSKLDLQRQARIAREEDAKEKHQANISQIKRDHASRTAAQRAAGAGVGPTIDTRVPARPRPANCHACQAALKPDDDWCPKCGQGVSAAGSTEECKECGGTVIDGECISCGWTKGQEPAARPPEAAPVAPTSERRPAPAAPLPTALAAPTGPPLDAAPASPSRTPEVLMSCPTCSSPLTRDMVICDVCGEAVKK